MATATLGLGDGLTLVSCWGGWLWGRSELTTAAHIYVAARAATAVVVSKNSKKHGGQERMVKKKK